MLKRSFFVFSCAFLILLPTKVLAGCVHFDTKVPCHKSLKADQEEYYRPYKGSIVDSTVTPYDGKHETLPPLWILLLICFPILLALMYLCASVFSAMSRALKRIVHVDTIDVAVMLLPADKIELFRDQKGNFQETYFRYISEGRYWKARQRYFQYLLNYTQAFVLVLADDFRWR